MRGAKTVGILKMHSVCGAGRIRKLHLGLPLAAVRERTLGAIQQLSRSPITAEPLLQRVTAVHDRSATISGSSDLLRS